MSTASTERRFVSQLAHNEQVSQTFLASEKTLRPNRNGNLYLQVDLSDKSGSINARLWNASESDFTSFSNGDYVKVEGTTQLFQGNMQLIVTAIRRAATEEVEESDYQRLKSEEIDRYATRLTEILRNIKTPSLLNLADCFLMDEVFMAKFVEAPAGMKNHHAYQGGLIEHVLSVMELALLITPRYPQMDSDLLIMGAFLHDLSKVDELFYGREIGYTDEGQLLGHMVMGMTLLDEKIAEAEKLSGEPMPHALVIQLKHLIISHHGEYEYGSSKLPMTLEAVALNLIDNLDAKMASFGQLIEDCPNIENSWTQYYPNLGRKLYKGAVDQPNN